jgi:DNA-binding MarR family transcriptional regulator/GNAT superfamily N-acetyltransferase
MAEPGHLLDSVKYEVEHCRAARQEAVMAVQDADTAIAAVRRFSRFYTRRIGVLEDGLLGGPLSLTEGRVVYELAQAEETTATRLGAELGLDAGYLSRILRSFSERGLVDRRPSQRDGRESVLSLTEAGRALFATMDARSQAEVGAMLSPLTPTQRMRLVAALGTATELLGGGSETGPACSLRLHRPGDMGWVVHRHAVLYAEEYGWDESFEALVAEVAAQFIRAFDPAHERCWIAERDGAPVGSVFLVRGGTAEVGKLRLLYVEPDARGLGVGRQLVEACIGFARQAGYRRITLWTNSVLVAARGIYQRAGFRMVEAKPHHSFGHDLVGETWELDL